MSDFREFHKAQIGPHYQPEEPAWPNPMPEDLGDASGTTDETGMDYLPLPARKSFFDICNENPLIVNAYQEAPLVKSMIDTIGESFREFEDVLKDSVCSHMEKMDEFNKSFGEALESLSDFVATGNAKLEEIDQAQTETEVAKSLPGNISYIPTPYEQTEDPVSVRDKMVKAEQRGDISPDDILRYEMTGQIPERVQKSLG